MIDGAPLDLAKTYTVSTFSFLAAGGDNFTAFKEGKAKDTGLVDRDLWIKYLGDNQPVAPDFDREQIYASGPQGRATGPVRRRGIVFTKLDMNALGAPKNTKVDLVKVNSDNSKLTVGGGRGRRQRVGQRGLHRPRRQGSASWRQASKTTLARAGRQDQADDEGEGLPEGEADQGQEDPGPGQGQAQVRPVALRSRVG